MKLTHLLLQDLCQNKQDIILVAGELLSTNQIEESLKISLKEYNIKSEKDYNDFNYKNKSELINYTEDIIDYILLATKEDGLYQLSFNECVVFYTINLLYNSKKRTFSPESLSEHISEYYNIKNLFVGQLYTTHIREIIQKYALIKPFNSNRNIINPSLCYPVLNCSELSITISGEKITNYILLKKPNLISFKKDLDYFSCFMGIPTI